MWILDCVHNEALSILTEAQYQHLSLQVKELAGHDDPPHSDVLTLRPIENFFELKDKGGILGKLNIRVFYGIDHNKRAIIILGIINKQNDGPTPAGDKVRIRRRWRNFKDGNYGSL